MKPRVRTTEEFTTRSSEGVCGAEHPKSPVGRGGYWHEVGSGDWAAPPSTIKKRSWDGDGQESKSNKPKDMVYLGDKLSFPRFCRKKSE